MEPLEVETYTYTSFSFVRAGHSVRAASLRLFAGRFWVLSLAACVFWLIVGSAAGSVGQNPNALVPAVEHEAAASAATASATLVGFVDQMPHRSGPDRSGGGVPSPATQQPGDVPTAENDTHKVFGLTVPSGFLASPIEEAGSKPGFVIAEPAVAGGDPVTLLRGPPPEK